MNMDASVAKADSQAWWVILGGAAFFCYEFIQMQFFNATSEPLLNHFTLNASELGLLSATYFYADLILLIPAGYILDHYSVKRVLILSMVACLIGNTGFALTDSVWLAGFFRALTGGANAFAFLGCMVLATRWFPAKQLGLATSVFITIAFAGGMMAQTPFALLANEVGWQQALIYNSYLGIAILIFMGLSIQDYPANYCIPAKAQTSFKRMWQQLKAVSKNIENSLCGLFIALLNFPIMVISALWGSLYLTTVHFMSLTEATWISSLILLGSVFGGPFAGWISDYIGTRRKPMLILTSLSLIIAVFLLLDHPLSLTTLYILFFALGFFTSGQVIGYPALAERNPENLIGMATGFASLFIIGGGALFQPFFGWLLDWQGHSTYSIIDFNRAMLSLPIALAIAMLCAYLLKERFQYE